MRYIVFYNKFIEKAFFETLEKTIEDMQQKKLEEKMINLL
jgi:hypothetical protein